MLHCFVMLHFSPDGDATWKNSGEVVVVHGEFPCSILDDTRWLYLG